MVNKLLEELKINAFKYIIDLIIALIILSYALYRMNSSYNNIDKKINQIGDRIDSIATDVRIVTKGVSESSSEVFQDFKDNRKDVYKKVYSDGKSLLERKIKSREGKE